MIERTLVGVDFSPASIAAAQWVARELAPDAEMIVAHVLALPRQSGGSRPAKEELVLDTLRFGADQRLAALSRVLRPVRVWPEIVEGDPPVALLRVAREFRVDLVVVASRGVGESWNGIGSTATRLVQSSPVPVLILGDRLPSSPFHVLAPVERRFSALWAVTFARSLPQDSVRDLTLLHVIPSGPMSKLLTQGEWDDADYANGDAWNDRWNRLARNAGWPAAMVRTEELPGKAAEVIRHAVSRLHADLVVMPRRNVGGLRRRILGSVTEAVVREVPCAVVVVPERPVTAAAAPQPMKRQRTQRSLKRA